MEYIKNILRYVYKQTQQRYLSAEFALLPMSESGYDPFAYSSTGATSLWQMMPRTDSSFGLWILAGGMTEDATP